VERTFYFLTFSLPVTDKAALHPSPDEGREKTCHHDLPPPTAQSSGMSTFLFLSFSETVDLHK